MCTHNWRDKHTAYPFRANRPHYSPLRRAFVGLFLKNAGYKQRCL